MLNNKLDGTECFENTLIIDRRAFQFESQVIDDFLALHSVGSICQVEQLLIADVPLIIACYLYEKLVQLIFGHVATVCFAHTCLQT